MSRIVSIILVLFLSGVVSNAHEQKAALSDILFNERTGNLEVAHRFILHDAEHTLHKATKVSGDLVRSAEAQEAFAKYVASRFTLRLADGSVVPLTLVGQEVERGYLWVYQETKLPQRVGFSFSIENTILQDVLNGQINTVNVRYRSQVATFVFEAGSGRKLYKQNPKNE